MKKFFKIFSPSSDVPQDSVLGDLNHAIKRAQLLRMSNDPNALTEAQKIVGNAILKVISERKPGSKEVAKADSGSFITDIMSKLSGLFRTEKAPEDNPLTSMIDQLGDAELTKVINLLRGKELRKKDS